MEIDSSRVQHRAERQAQFELTAPRRFLLPALLLLISEEPRHGYSLAKEVQQLRLGRVDRPSVYRVLARLEQDGLVTPSAGTPRAGQERRSYCITDEGEQVLRQWMGVIKDERDGLDRVLRRYVATETLEARLAEVVGGWQSVVGPALSAVSPSSHQNGSVIPTVHRRTRLATEAATAPAGVDVGSISRYEINPERSVVLIDARSSVGPITFGALGIEGWFDLRSAGGRVVADDATRAQLEVTLDRFRSGNGLYDAELMRRIEARRFPVVRLRLSECRPIATTDRYRVNGDVGFHGTTRSLEGSVELTQSAPDTVVVTGEQVIDIRDFGITSPSVLMLRIYPDVQVKIQIEAVRRPRGR